MSNTKWSKTYGATEHSATRSYEENVRINRELLREANSERNKEPGKTYRIEPGVCQRIDTVGGPAVGNAAVGDAPVEQPRIFTNNGKVYERVETPLFRAMSEVPAVAVTQLGYEWTGPGMTIAMWHRITSFLRWANATHHCEAQVRLYVRLDEQRWDAWAYPQSIAGMTTHEIEGVDMDAQRAQWPAVWKEAGTVHSHCNASAFQSGTDRNDEHGRDGIHLTVGHCASTRYDLHARVCMVLGGRKSMFSDVALSQWFDVPEQYRGLPPAIRNDVLRWLLCEPVEAEFPAVWRSNMRESVRRQQEYVKPSNGEYGQGNNAGFASTRYGYGENENFVKELVVDMSVEYGDMSLEVIREYVQCAAVIEDVMRSHRIYQHKEALLLIDKALARSLEDENGAVDALMSNAPSNASGNGQASVPSLKLVDEAEAWQQAQMGYGEM